MHFRNFLYAKYCFKCFVFIDLCNPHNNPVIGTINIIISTTNEETKAERVTSSKLISL